eukprot:CAMPEP_0202726242 /NCGR_PEP_ID=MMETSP1385-20130828/184514_1 /ASSEMBLY_ACC=CAM_ASM_000861 /TAXON_ID=933848 /ORGANISM="Elphidium margaritaceum" /LENGTH=869 /DNA_ID=CAMNT_0049392459 /DNA_START=42 /DNA_END=2649 /DNA_ORIENTATION=+
MSRKERVVMKVLSDDDTDDGVGIVYQSASSSINALGVFVASSLLLLAVGVMIGFFVGHSQSLPSINYNSGEPAFVPAGFPDRSVRNSTDTCSRPLCCVPLEEVENGTSCRYYDLRTCVLNCDRCEWNCDAAWSPCACSQSDIENSLLALGYSGDIGSIVQVQSMVSDIKATLSPSGTWIEASAEYRVSITPQYADSKISVTFDFGWNGHGLSENTIVLWSAAKSTDSGSTFARDTITSAGIASGSRHVIAGMASRRNNGFDANDPNMCHWTIYDEPQTTDTVTYTLQVFQEYWETGSLIIGQSSGDSDVFGWTTPVSIVAMEIRKAVSDSDLVADTATTADTSSDTCSCAQSDIESALIALGYSGDIGSIVQVQSIVSDIKATLSPSGTWVEASAEYRVSITPQYADSKISVTFDFGWNGHGLSKNTIVLWSAAKSTDGGSTFARDTITSAGIASGSRHVIAGMASRRNNGFDANDPNMCHWTIYDEPQTTDTVTYRNGHGLSKNTIVLWSAAKSTDGGSTFVRDTITSAGIASGSRHVIAGMASRRNNGFDANDPNMCHWTIYDEPQTTDTVTYTLQVFQEYWETGSLTIGQSNGVYGDSDVFGWTTPVTIIAMEIRNAKNLRSCLTDMRDELHIFCFFVFHHTVTYTLQVFQEYWETGSLTIGRSNGDSAVFGWTTPVSIVASEIRETSPITLEATLPSDNSELCSCAPSDIQDALQSLGYSNDYQMGSVVQVQSTLSHAKVRLSPSGTWTEASADYRVSIAPRYADSTILLTYNFGWNGHGVTENTIVLWSAAKSTDGGDTFARDTITSAGATSGSRHVLTGMASRRNNGFDGNDPNMCYWTSLDEPQTTDAVTYTLQVFQEYWET